MNSQSNSGKKFGHRLLETLTVELLDIFLIFSQDQARREMESRQTHLRIFNQYNHQNFSVFEETSIL